MAIRQAQSCIKDGCRWVVDLDLEKFFDRVNHDRLMNRLGSRIRDKRVLQLIGRFLRSGVMIGGLCETTEEGTPQGGPLSPLLSNIVLDELDKELERRGLPDSLARPLAATRKGPWHISANSYLARALPTQYFTRTLGLVLFYVFKKSIGAVV